MASRWNYARRTNISKMNKAFITIILIDWNWVGMYVEQILLLPAAHCKRWQRLSLALISTVAVAATFISFRLHSFSNQQKCCPFLSLSRNSFITYKQIYSKKKKKKRNLKKNLMSVEVMGGKGEHSFLKCYFLFLFFLSLPNFYHHYLSILKLQFFFLSLVEPCLQCEIYLFVGPQPNLSVRPLPFTIGSISMAHLKSTSWPLAWNLQLSFS